MTASVPNSDRPSGADFLVIGRVLGPHGVRGAVKVEIITDFPERFRRLRWVYVGDEHTRVAVKSARRAHASVILQLAGYTSPEEAGRLRGQYLSIPASEAVPLPEGRYYWHQIVGLAVETVQGEQLGRVTEILETGANDVYLVRGDRGELLIPAIADVIKEVDLSAGRLIVAPLPGLL